VTEEGTAASGEDAALRTALAAEHAAVWGYGVVGAALPPESGLPAGAASRPTATSGTASPPCSTTRDADPVPAEAGYALPFPVLSAVDAAALAVVLEEGRVGELGGAARRRRAVGGPPARRRRAERRGGPRRRLARRAGRSPVTAALPGLPTS
jgi:hypothetical protein